MELSKKNLNKKKYSCQFNINFEKDFLNSNQTYIHSTSIIGPNVELDQGVKIGPFCIIQGQVQISSNTQIFPNVVIGTPAQNLDTNDILGKIKIGKNCRIREFTTVGACKNSKGKTIIGDNCYIMSYVHVAHDVTLENNVTLINNVNLGGHVYIEKNAFLMSNSAAHQFCKIGQFCGLSSFSAIRQDIPPFCKFDGIPAKFCGLNSIAMKRAGFDDENINAIKHVVKLFYQDKFLLDDIKTLIKKEDEKWWGQNENVQKFLKFIENSNRGISRKTIKDKS